jgi:hypothetical protein
MSAQHTPGPWQTNGSHIYGPDPFRRLVAQALSPDGRCLSDRDLIAAAPELLEALIDAVEIMDDQLGGDFPDSLAAFRAVIAKAKGCAA